ncbi:MAG: hypothetical protein ACJ8NS_08095 [Chthoniobacterales bacterium]
MTAANTPFFEVPEAYYRQVFRWVFRGAIALGVCFGGAAAFWPEYNRPLLSVPIVAAGVAGMVLGWLGAGRYREEFVREFTSNFWLRLQTSEATKNIAAVDVFEHMVPDAGDRRKIHRIKTTDGELYLLHVQRFIELLVSRSMDDADSATEHALGVAWNRCVGELRPDLDPVLSKAFREAFKSDLAASMIAMIHRSGAQLVEELSAIGEREDRIQAVDQPFKLEPMTPTSKTPRTRGRPRR